MRLLKIYPFEVLIEKEDFALNKVSKAQCHQIRTISKLRIKSKKVGKINEKLMEKIEYALKLHLDFD
jgi:mRNA interferase MazF